MLRSHFTHSTSASSFSAPRALWSCVVLIQRRNRPFKRVELAKKKAQHDDVDWTKKRVYIFSFRGIVHALLVHSRKKYKSELANWGVFSRLSARSVDNFFLFLFLCSRFCNSIFSRRSSRTLCRRRTGSFFPALANFSVELFVCRVSKQSIFRFWMHRRWAGARKSKPVCRLSGEWRV